MNKPHSDAMSYNELWAIAYEYASNRGMSEHRCEQFAAAYSQVYENQPIPYVLTPARFEKLLAKTGSQYHHEGVSR